MSFSIDLERLIRPIDGPDPAGPDLVHGPLYRQLDQAREPELDEQGRPRESDWKTVVRLGVEAIYDQSKDIQVAAYVVEALGWLEGPDGLCKGFDLILALQEAFWDSAYPSIRDGDLGSRIVPYEFLDEIQVLPRLLYVGIPLTPRTSGGEPYFLQRWLGIRTAEQTAARDEVIRRTKPEFYTNLAFGLDGLRASFEAWARATSARLGDRAPSMKRIENALSEMANCLAKIHQISPFPRIKVQQPTDETVEDDPTNTADAAADADASPTSSAAVAPQVPTGLVEGRGPASMAADLAASGKLDEAVALLDRARQSACCQRDRFFRQLELVELLIRIGSNAVARPLLDELSELSASYRLQDWEDPSLTARLLVARLITYRTSKSEEDAALIPGVFNLLCRIDPGRALEQGHTAVEPASRG